VNPVDAIDVATPPGEKKKRKHIVAAVQRAVGTMNKQGFWNDDLSERIPHVDIPAAYQMHQDPDLEEAPCERDEDPESEVEDDAEDQANESRLAMLATNMQRSEQSQQQQMIFVEYVVPSQQLV